MIVPICTECWLKARLGKRGLDLLKLRPVLARSCLPICGMKEQATIHLRSIRKTPKVWRRFTVSRWWQEALFLSLLVVASSVIAASGCEDALKSSPGLNSALQDAVAEGIPGVTMSVARGGQIIWSGAAGYADIERKLLATRKRHSESAALQKHLWPSLPCNWHPKDVWT
jgi:hypothetical protein